MLTVAQALRRSALVALGLAALAGTAAAQGTPDQNQPVGQDQPAATGAYGGTTYGGTTYGAPVQTQAPDVDVDTSPTYVNVPPAEEPMPPPEDTFERYGIGVSLGGGVDGFASDDMTDFTDVGGSWNVRVDVGKNSFLGFEGLYIGSAQSIDAIGLDSDSILVGNGLQGNLRLNLLTTALQPFAFGGVAWRHYDLTNSDFNTSAILDEDDVIEFPFGAGVGWRYAGFTLDARGEYRIATGEDMVPLFTADGSDKDAEMHRWGVNANIGYEF